MNDAIIPRTAWMVAVLLVLATAAVRGQSADGFDPNAGLGAVYAIAMQTDGKILLGGNFTKLSPNGGVEVSRNNIARLNPDGTLDMAFDPSPNTSSVRSIAVQADGKILVGGTFNRIGGQPRNGIARLDGTTGLADSFDPNANANAAVLAIAVQADGKIIASGNFTTIGGQPRNRIARLDGTTGLADSFDPSADGTIISIAVQADGKVLAGGLFTSIGGQPRNRIARLAATTGTADSFDPNADGEVDAIGVQTDGKILVGGGFTVIGGEPRRIARLDAVTGLADSFNPSPNTSELVSITVQADGKVLAGGSFTGIGGQPRNGIARLNATTGLADLFNPNANGSVTSITIQADGKVLVGGGFTSIGGQTRNHIARLTNDTAAVQDLAVTQTTITWTRGGSSPQLTRVTFEYSADNVTYTPLGHGTASGSNWTLTGLNLPTGQNFYIRARGYYRSGWENASESIAESVWPTPTPSPTPTPTPSPTPSSTLANISTRLRVETGDNALIGGFIIKGSQPKKVIMRALGPSLPLAGRLSDPALELRNSTGILIFFNDNWRSSQEAEIIATGIPPSNNSESAIVATLLANNSAYTAIVRGVNYGTGVGLVEAYDLDPTVDSKLANISTRGLVQTGDNVLIGGLIVQGQDPLRVIIRAIGPSLPVAGALGDPTLELRDANGALIRSNDNWRSDQEAEIIATGIPPANNLESAIVATLPANNATYTAIVRGVNGTTGIALVEVYALN